MPVYNGERFLEECLESIRRQTYHNIEVVVVDDGSTDASAMIIRRYVEADSRFRYVYQQNAGLSGARNTALDIISGEYVAMVDADDVIHEEFINSMYVISLETGGDIVCCRHSNDINGIGLSNECFISMDTDRYMYLALSQKGMNHSVWGKLYRSCIWDNLRFSPYYYEDLDIFPRVFLRAETVAVTEARLYYYRPNDQSITNTFSPRRLDVLRAIENVISILKNKGCDTKLINAAYARRMSAMFNIFLITCRQPDYYSINR
ncbi:MAG: glycosyltransferase, partial [Muribaculaceae bacterium]|nr:glycosyltransferase [Muribaculaceae bacterium]